MHDNFNDWMAKVLEKWNLYDIIQNYHSYPVQDINYHENKEKEYRIYF